MVAKKGPPHGGEVEGKSWVDDPSFSSSLLTTAVITLSEGAQAPLQEPSSSMDIDVSVSSSRSDAAMTASKTTPPAAKMQGVSKGTSLHEGGVRWVHAASRKRRVARMTASKPKHILEMQDDDKDKEVPLCASTVYGAKEKDDDMSDVKSEEEPDEEPEAACAACSAYVQHITVEYTRDNGGLSAVLQLRDLYHNHTGKPTALTKLEGALEVTTAAAKAAEVKA
ncbi:hypothetical protein B0H10DRAFT_1943792 [Mycena sp. CBHHK59/15]|nr:hypothetical protein B0H10DRAFT_1943792 [Mycena sp. CBHHK59/15]